MSLYHYYIHNKSIDLNCDLKQFVKEIKLKNKRAANLNNDREEIRRKLAMVSSSSSSSSILNTESGGMNGVDSNCGAPVISDYFRKSNFSKQHLLGQNLQICFINELSNDEAITNDPSVVVSADNNNFVYNNHDDHDDDEDNINNYNNNNNNNKNHSDGDSSQNGGSCGESSTIVPNFCSILATLNSNSSESSFENVLSQLQSETKKAMAKVPSEVKTKLQSEKIVPKKPSPIADIVGLPTYGLKRLERDQIVDMNIGQLQVIVNDLCNQIEKINEELKKMLIDRDDLYMQQDSLLVDVEDISRRIQEYILRFKKEKLIAASSCDEMNKNGSAKLPSSVSTNGLADKINSLLHFSTLSRPSNGGSNAHTKANTSQTTSNNSNNSNEKNIIDDSSKAKQSFQLSNLTNKLYRFTNKKN